MIISENVHLLRWKVTCFEAVISFLGYESILVICLLSQLGCHSSPKSCDHIHSDSLQRVTDCPEHVSDYPTILVGSRCKKSGRDWNLMSARAQHPSAPEILLSGEIIILLNAIEGRRGYEIHVNANIKNTGSVVRNLSLELYRDMLRRLKLSGISNGKPTYHLKEETLGRTMPARPQYLFVEVASDAQVPIEYKGVLQNSGAGGAVLFETSDGQVVEFPEPGIYVARVESTGDLPGSYNTMRVIVDDNRMYSVRTP